MCARAPRARRPRRRARRCASPCRRAALERGRRVRCTGAQRRFVRSWTSGSRCRDFSKFELIETTYGLTGYKKSARVTTMYSSAGARRLQFPARLLRVVLELLLAFPVGVGQARSSFRACGRSGPRSRARTRSGAGARSGARARSGSRARTGAGASPFSATGDAEALAGKRLPACFACRFRLAQRLLGCPHLRLVLFALDPGFPKFLQDLDLARTGAADAGL